MSQSIHASPSVQLCSLRNARAGSAKKCHDSNITITYFTEEIRHRQLHQSSASSITRVGTQDTLKFLIPDVKVTWERLKSQGTNRPLIIPKIVTESPKTVTKSQTTVSNFLKTFETILIHPFGTIFGKQCPHLSANM